MAGFKKRRGAAWFLAYLAFAIVFIGASSTLCKYALTESSGGITTPINMGSPLYFLYKRNDIGYGSTGSVIPIPLTVETIEVQGENKECIVVHNIKPGDNIIYSFSVYNYKTDVDQSLPDINDSNISIKNTVHAEYHITVYAEVQIPIHGVKLPVDCNLAMKRVNDSSFSGYTSDRRVTLLPYGRAVGQSIMIDTFEVEINVREQQYQAEDYFGASLTIYIFIDAVQRTSS